MYPTYNRNSRHNDQRLAFSWPSYDVGNKKRCLPDYWTGKDSRHHIQELVKKGKKEKKAIVKEMKNCVNCSLYFQTNTALEA